MMSFTDRLEQYVAVRRRFGYDLTSSARELRPFVTFADAEGATRITVALFLRWKERFGSASTLTWFFRLCHVRGFATWLQSIEPRTEIPPAGLIPGRQRRPRPYIYTDSEIARIVTETARLPSDHGLRGRNCSTLFGLLAVTGLRVGEAVRLDDRDVDLEAAVLQVRHARTRLELPARLSRRFVAFAERHETAFITTECALQWATKPRDAQPAQGVKSGIRRIRE